MKKQIFLSLTVILSFLIIINIKYFWGYLVFGPDAWKVMALDNKQNLVLYSQITLVFATVFVLFKNRTIEVLGLNKDLPQGLLIGLICALPMFIGYGFMSGFKTDISASLLHRDMIAAGFNEEVLYRGFAFGILFFRAGWGFIPAVIIPSIFFGIGHIYQADSFGEAINIFLFTAFGSAGFAWFYTVWKNLWVLIFLHGFMDLAWDVFRVETNVSGNLPVNIFRFISLGIIIYLSVKKHGNDDTLSLKNRLWINRIDNSEVDK